MSMQNGVNELYFQDIQFKFKSVNGEILLEKWNILKDNNVSPIQYDFIKEIILDIPCECKSLDELKYKFQVSIQQRLSNDELTLVEIINDTGKKILTLEEQKNLLNQIGLFAFNESLIFSEQKLSQK